MFRKFDKLAVFLEVKAKFQRKFSGDNLPNVIHDNNASFLAEHTPYNSEILIINHVPLVVLYNEIKYPQYMSTPLFE